MKRLDETISKLKGLPEGYGKIKNIRAAIRDQNYEKFQELCYVKMDWDSGFARYSDMNYAKFILSDLCQDVITYVPEDQTKYFGEIFDFIGRINEDSEKSLSIKAANYELLLANSKLNRQVVDACSFDTLCQLTKTAIFKKNDASFPLQFRPRFSSLDMITYDTIRKGL